MQTTLLKSVTLAILVLIMACSGKEENKQELKAKKPMGVDASIVIEKTLDHTFSFTGSLMANEEIELRPEASGRVVKINFQEGKPVAKGQLLLKINDNDLQAQMKKNQLQIELAADDEKRKKEILAIKGISQEEYDNSANKLKTLQAEKELLLAQIAKTEIIAPFAGIVGLRSISEGAFVSQTTIISTLKQIDPVKIEFSLPEKYNNGIKVGKSIEFTVQGEVKPFKANIYAIESNIDPLTRTIRLRATCANPQQKLMPGAFANILYNFSNDDKSLVVPAKAIVPVLDASQVYLIKNGNVKSSKVTTGVRTSTEVEIISGVSVGDTLIVSGLLQIKEGMPVTARLPKGKAQTSGAEITSAEKTEKSKK